MHLCIYACVLRSDAQLQDLVLDVDVRHGVLGRAAIYRLYIYIYICIRLYVYTYYIPITIHIIIIIISIIISIYIYI